MHTHMHTYVCICTHTHTNMNGKIHMLHFGKRSDSQYRKEYHRKNPGTITEDTIFLVQPTKTTSP